MNPALNRLRFAVAHGRSRQPSPGFKAFLCLVILTAGVTDFCHATSTVDQAFTGENSAASIINDGASSVAQTFTAGLSGTLTGINIDIYSYYVPGNFPLHVAIRGVNDGLPNNLVLGETTLNVSAISLDRPVTFPQMIPVTAGLQYSIVVNYAGATPQDHAQGAWIGSTATDGYVGGMPFGLYGQTWTPTSSIDLHFRTYVQPVPEPSVLGYLFPLGVGFAFSAGRLPTQLGLGWLSGLGVQQNGASIVRDDSAPVASSDPDARQ